MRAALFKHFVLNDVMELPLASTGQLPHAHMLCMLCENEYQQTKPAEPPGLDDWLNWPVDGDLLVAIDWAHEHMKKFHPELLTRREG